jgi:hypothetical protein
MSILEYITFAVLSVLSLSINTKGQTTQNINVCKWWIEVLSNSIIQQSIIVFVNEEGNLVAEKAVDVAVNYIKKNNKLGVNTEPVKVIGNRSDASALLDSCKFR